MSLTDKNETQNIFYDVYFSQLSIFHQARAPKITLHGKLTDEIF